LGENPETPVDQVVKETIDAEHAALKSQFDELFRDALDTKDRPREVQRTAIAHILLNAVPLLQQGDAAQAQPAAAPDMFDVEAYPRAFAVVGLEAAVKEMNREAKILSDIQGELAQELARDRSNFAVAHTQLVGQAEDLAERVERARAEVERAH